MTSTKRLAVMTMNIFGMFVLSTTLASPTDYSTLLNQLVQKSMASKRPIIFIIDNDAQRSLNWNNIKLLKKIHPDHGTVPFSAPSDDLAQKSKMRLKNKAAIKKIRKGTKALEKKFQALLPSLKQKLLQEKKRGYKPPIIRSLLRISNNLRCQARNECEDDCGNDDNDQDECRNSCEQKFECEKEPEEDPCKDDDACEEENECESDNCEKTTRGSTKGYTDVEPTEPRCPEC